MHDSVANLLSKSNSAIGHPLGKNEQLRDWGVLGGELAEVLQARNGFYAFESALLVRPLENFPVPLGILQWNTPELWKRGYAIDLSDALFFAEDIFGGQYCIRHDYVCAFDPETGLFEPTGQSLGEWAKILIADYQFRTGFPIAHGWQAKHGPLPAGMRLHPKVPFVCGGEFDIDNLYPIADFEGMSFRACIANQICDLPDGSEIVLKGIS